MTPRPGRRIGRTLLKLEHVEARHTAISKLDGREGAPIIVGFDGSRTRDADALVARRPDGRIFRLAEVRPLELPGHHLQRAAAENA